MKALVTGATGFVGSHLVEALVGNGSKVRALVRDPLKARPLAELGVELVQGDLQAPETLRGVAEGVDAVFHAAAQLNLPGVRPEAYETNLAGTRNLVEALRGVPVRKLVHLSSIAAMGIRNVHEVDETCPCRPDLPYGKSKLAVDRYLESEFREHGLPVVILRPPTVYGPRERYNFLSLCRAIEARRFLVIGSGLNRIDFLWIGHLVHAMVQAAELGRAGETYLVADEPVLSFVQAAETLASLLGRPLPRIHLPTPLAYLASVPLLVASRITGREMPLNPKRVRTMTGDMCFDLTKAKDELLYRPGGTFLEHAGETIAWYRSVGLLPPSPAPAD